MYACRGDTRAVVGARAGVWARVWVSPVSRSASAAMALQLQDILNDETTREVTGSPLSPTASSDSSQQQQQQQQQEFACRWDSCSEKFMQPELLYSHVCQDHVGRKSKKNLQLNCHWDHCDVKTVKRDHITSHVRVHIPLKPFQCSNCAKKFKRPQDLKKHLKTHLEGNELLKRKRGPKTGSKRVGKAGASAARANYTIKPLARFVAEDLPHLDPSFNPQLVTQLQRYLPLPSQGQPLPTGVLYRKNSFSSTTSSSDVSSPASSPTATHHITNSSESSPSDTSLFNTINSMPKENVQTMATFFNKLSYNMGQQQQTVGNQYYRQVMIPVPTVPRLATISATTPPVLEKYPTMQQLPPLSATAGPIPSTNPPMMNTSQKNVTVLPPMSTMPLLTSRFNSQPQMSTNVMPPLNNSNGVAYHYRPFSMYQKSNGQTEACVEEEFEDIYSAVNLIRDYLVCSLLEEEGSDEEDVPDETSTSEIEDMMSKMSVSSTGRLKYPKIRV
ncbi:alkaline-responsive transcriptional regulator RIM101 KNAG_0J02850 [Huiozyma naganishii CBS 8797]|uniref:C2H2-type domain-containing protein n=1 Tax=Huiozyma naganishii (strain ATCC MYA-139 / BCRC 22969 / CBS 8797 / KCTC 17520 / NBRC 10181 / NCYC 3082 / Yp74L-3) TaxID=1071383 RepID=J7S9Y1_HUIN7|nr:hypothetical protein KNAG_0J02850 [Kazachstania naganishii CBS 8797]CCK72364.1 hypothetical protein KNAG_0J02850 [Kazachstania naganishii CBS 8797]